MNAMRPKRLWFPYLMASPAALLIVTISIYPIFSGIFMSFTNMSLMNPTAWKLIGLDNFAKILKDREFLQALSFTLIYSFATVVFSYLVGLICALLMNRPMRARGVVRALLLTPWVVPVVIGATAWMWLLNDQTGFVNILLKQLGLIQKPILFLGQANSARWTAIAFATWKAFPFMTVVLLSSMQSISQDVYEASTIDGASGWQTLVRITMPLIRRESMLIILLQSMWMFNNFDNIFLLTKGGPAKATQVMSIYAYNTAFYRSSMGYGSAISVSMMLFMIILCMVYFRLNRKNVEE